MEIPKELKKIEVSFFHDERYIYNMKFFARDGQEFALSYGGFNGPGRVETVEFAENEHLLSCELDYMLPDHGCTEFIGVTWIKWVVK